MYEEKFVILHSYKSSRLIMLQSQRFNPPTTLNQFTIKRVDELIILHGSRLYC